MLFELFIKKINYNILYKMQNSSVKDITIIIIMNKSIIITNEITFLNYLFIKKKYYIKHRIALFKK